MTLTYLLATILTVVAAAVTTLQVVLTLLFRGRRGFFRHGPRAQSGAAGTSPPDDSSPHRRRISILKPVCGLDDDLEANLESFAALGGIDYEMIVSVASADDAARPIVERVMGRHPEVDWRRVVGGDARLERGNRKIARLIAAMRVATGDVVLISDSNVRVRPDDVVRTVAAFDDPHTGCVSNLFTGSDAASFGAGLESLHLLSFVVPGAVLASAANTPCVVGKSMAIRRDVLAAIGGFEAFAGVLAEDQAIGLAVREAGFAVVLSPVVVRNVVIRRTLRRALERQIRWNKIRYAFSKPTYCAELLLFPLPFAMSAAVLHPAAVLLPVWIALLRVAQVAALARATGASLRPQDLASVPLFDLLHFAGHFAPYFDDRVTWRGFATRLGPNTALIERKAEAS